MTEIVLKAETRLLAELPRMRFHAKGCFEYQSKQPFAFKMKFTRIASQPGQSNGFNPKNRSKGAYAQASCNLPSRSKMISSKPRCFIGVICFHNFEKLFSKLNYRYFRENIQFLLLY